MKFSDDVSSWIARWMKSPLTFVREGFNVEPYPWQKKVLEDFLANRNIALLACKGPGKSALLAWLSWWFLLCHQDAIIPAASFTSENLRDNLWKEMAVWMNTGPVSPILKRCFKHTATRIFSLDSPATWFMSARTWSRTAAPEDAAKALAGFHGKNVLFLLDEAGGIPAAVLREAKGAQSTGGNTRILIAGNPTDHDGALYQAAVNEKKSWYVVEITGDPDDPNRSPNIDIMWAREQIELYGRDNPWVMSQVLGKFPPGALNALISVTEVQAAQKKNYTKDFYEFSQKRIGVDVARFGDDKTCLFPRQGLRAFKPVVLRHSRATEIADRLMAAKRRWMSEVEYVDGTGGYGGGVVDSCLAAGIRVREVNFSSSADDTERFFNKRAEIWWRMADWVKRGGALPNEELCPGILAQLTEMRYGHQNGKIRMEEKEQYKKRLGKSCDEADALALTFTSAEMKAAKVYPHPSMDPSNSPNEYDALKDNTLYEPFRDI